MPPKYCASCTKSVFPMEELKCLDKTWHKGCFKCQVCNMTLNMKNYKGYDKLPYCNAHYPETKFTSVADTPESKRLAQNSKIQSNVQYHSDFESSKGQYTFTSDNPEMKRHLMNTNNTSLVKYHEEYEKERGQYTAVADDPETLRVRKNMETISNVAYHGEIARRQEMENTRPNEYEPSDAPPRSYHQAPPTSYTAPPPQRQPSYQSQQQPMAPPPQQGYGRRPGSINDYDPTSGNANSPYSSKTQSTTAYSSQANPAPGGRLGGSGDYNSSSNQRTSQGGLSYGGQHSLPPVAAYNTGPYKQQATSYTQNQPAQQSYPTSAPQQAYRAPYNPGMAPPAHQQQPMRPPQQQQQYQPPPQQQYQPPPQQQRAPPPQQRAPQQQPRDPYYGKGKVSTSIYDYAAADDDEVGFMEGDMIIHCEPIDDGWMTGTVERTGEHGMLPSNYVEHVNW